MYNAHAAWTPGAANVTGQKYSWIVDGDIAASGELSATAAARDSAADNVVVNHGNQVAFAVSSFNQWNESEPLVINGVAPTPTPDAPTGGQMSFSEIGGIP